MKLIFATLIALILIKGYTFSSYKEKVSKLEQTLSYINYDLKSNRLENKIQIQEDSIIELTNFQPNWYNASKNLFTKLKSSHFDNIGQLINIFNTSPLREFINYSDITFDEKVELSKKHNELLLISSGHSSVIKKLVLKKKKLPYERPYLVSLNKGRDSMDIILINAMHGKIDGLQIAYNGDTTEINSLPINIGHVKGEVSLIVIDSLREDNLCYRRVF